MKQTGSARQHDEGEPVKKPKADSTSEHSFNWEAAKQRLSEVARVLDQMQELSPEQAKKLLDERARALARVPALPPDSREVIEVIVFGLSGGRFAVETRFVREVLRSFVSTPVPGRRDFLIGVTNLRGEILAVMNLSSFFNLDTTATSDQRPWLLVLGTERAEFGIVAHEVVDVRMLRLDEIHPPPGSITGVALDCTRGVTADAVIVLDGAALLSHQHLVVDDSE
jgi:purine-binding chemotaxis protein CheW